MARLVGEVVDYTILEYGHKDTLTSKVKDMIRETALKQVKWQPEGGMTFGNLGYVQTMVLVDTTKKEN